MAVGMALWWWRVCVEVVVGMVWWRWMGCGGGGEGEGGKTEPA
jgi:hypothetical protein